MHISEINIYPIKSLKGISLESALVEPRGLQYDRRWMLTDKDGMFFTQREFPRMATIRVSIESGKLKVESDGTEAMNIPFEPDSGDRRQVTIWRNVCDGVVYVGAISEWFSDVLGTSCQLVYMPDDTKRSVNPLFDQGGDVVSFADGYPVLVIGEASLADLNKRIGTRTPSSAVAGSSGETSSGFALIADEGVRVPMNRFRPNIVVSGSDAYSEDDWRRIRVGDAVFRATKPCERCVVTTVDQAKGDFAGKEPLRTLATYRMAKDVMPESFAQLGVGENAVLFGQNLIAESHGATIKTGDKVEIID